MEFNEALNCIENAFTNKIRFYEYLKKGYTYYSFALEQEISLRPEEKRYLEEYEMNFLDGILKEYVTKKDHEKILEKAKEAVRFISGFKGSINLRSLLMKNGFSKT